MMERRGEGGVGEPTQLCKDLITAQVSTTWTRSSGMKRCCDMRLPFKRKRQHSFATSSSQEEKVAPVLLRNRSVSQQHGERWFGAYPVFFSWWCTQLLPHILSDHPAGKRMRRRRGGANR